jgi:peroxiredoxin
MRVRGLVLSTVVAVVSLASTGFTQQGSGPLPAVVADVQALGPQVGSIVPDFSLSDQNGRTRTLRSLMGPEGLMLVFSRSADWCPYCKTQMVEIQGRVDELRRSGLGVAVITYDPVAVLADFARRRQVSFPLLSDKGSAVIKRYGILNTIVDPKNENFGYPFPGTFMLDARGVVTSRFFEQAYQERSTVASVLVRLGGRLTLPATTVTSPQMTITSYVTDQTVAPGTHFSVVLDITPGPKMHVYAPGVSGGYRPIGLSLDLPSGVSASSAQYPPSETYVFEPLNERVQVYQKPFRIVQDVVVAATPAAAAALGKQVTLTGTLRYQACDDKICFSPQAVPLTWTVSVGELDRERAAR